MPEERETHTILIVEDEVLVRMTIADYLRECGFQVAEAGSADEALSILNSEMPVDLVFSDVQMPGTMNGFGLAHWIRQHRPDLKGHSDVRGERRSSRGRRSLQWTAVGEAL